MKDLSSIETLAIPEGVDIKLKSRVVTVTGPRGTLVKAVKHIQMDIQIVSRGNIERTTSRTVSGDSERLFYHHYLRNPLDANFPKERRHTRQIGRPDTALGGIVLGRV